MNAVGSEENLLGWIFVYRSFGSQLIMLYSFSFHFCVFGTSRMMRIWPLSLQGLMDRLH